MPTRKIRDVDEFRPCSHPEHNPPSMMVFQPGVYEHECPACGKVIQFTVRPHHYLEDKIWKREPGRLPKVRWSFIGNDKLQVT